MNLMNIRLLPRVDLSLSSPISGQILWWGRADFMDLRGVFTHFQPKFM